MTLRKYGGDYEGAMPPHPRPTIGGHMELKRSLEDISFEIE
jgi:hypothetical protein